MEATTPAYPTRLSNTQWATLAAYFAADSQLGRRSRPGVSPTVSRSAAWDRLGW